MKRVLCHPLPKAGKPSPLSDDEANHVLRVMRLRDGDLLEAIDGRGGSVIARVRTQGGGSRLEFDSVSGASPHGVLPLELEIALLKGDAMEWVVEKAVELGVRRLVPVQTAHTVVQTKGKGPEAFRDRWQKIADQALKQCGRLELMEVALPISLPDLLASSTASAQWPRLWCDETEREKSAPLLAQAESLHASGYRLLVGPEGGWSDKERDILYAEIKQGSTHRVALGPLVLRAETACIFGVSVLAAALRKT